MSQTDTKIRSTRRAARVRGKVSGTADCPRLAVRISNRHVWAQLIDDTSGTTLAAASSLKATQGSLSQKAAAVGEAIAAAAAKAKVQQAVMDRGPHLYRQRLQALAEAARQKGLKF